MTPKEKAKELVSKFSKELPWYNQNDNLRKSKAQATICIDEMIEETRDYCDVNHHQDRMNYLENVKQEIQSL